MRTIDPRDEQLQAFADAPEPLAPLAMVNLLRFREHARYPEEFDAAPCSGHEAYQRYGAQATDQIAAVGGRVLWSGKGVLSVIAPEGEAWDEVIVVEYPSREAFLQMLREPAYQAIVPHRRAALLDSRLVATRPQYSLTP